MLAQHTFCFGFPALPHQEIPLPFFYSTDFPHSINWNRCFFICIHSPIPYT
jgi:hypothetical protein